MELFDNLVVDADVARAVDSAPLRLNEFGYDPWGFHPTVAKRSLTVAKRLVTYFRPEYHGLENIPSGRVLIVPNHAGQLPFDGLVIAVGLLRANPPRIVRAMVERMFPRVPFIAELFARGGAVVGDPINCRNLLRDDNAILVFPEGARGTGKTWPHRYQLEHFGRGFMRLALETNTPIVPVAVVGSEESMPSVSQARPIAKLLNLPYLPVPPHLPLLGPLAYLPLPVKFHVWFGEPMRFIGRADDEDDVIQGKVDAVQARVQEMLQHGLTQRHGWFS